jgi:hypothetical protein
VQHHAECGRGKDRIARRPVGLHEPPRARPQQPHQAEQQGNLRQREQQRVRVSPVVQQIAQRRGQQRREHQIQVGEVAGERAGGQQDTATGTPALRVGVGRQGAVDEFAEGQADEGVGQIIHLQSLS